MSTGNAQKRAGVLMRIRFNIQKLHIFHLMDVKGTTRRCTTWKRSWNIYPRKRSKN
jgi:hypothetical protein